VSRLIRDLHFNVAAGLGRVDCRGNSRGLQSNQRPLRSAENDDRYAEARKVLLIPNILIAGNKDIETGPFRFSEQVAVGQRFPPSFSCPRNDVTRQESGNTARRYVVKK
jgi:hypothetical protein